MLWQPQLPKQYTAMGNEPLVAAINARKAQLADQLVILGHHYQQDDVIQFADFTGDSFKLSQLAAQRVREVEAQYVIFAGVHFMAESADILTPDDVAVILPDLGAGCSMADMATFNETLDAWSQIHEVLNNGELCQSRPSEALPHNPWRVIPICYMNCSAAIKAFCGERGGAVCTSSNCESILRWALQGGDEPLREGQEVKILFLPDQHLGQNTASTLGFDPATDMAVWDPKDPNGTGGVDDEAIRRVTFLLWKGHCSVHMLFRPEHIDQIRAEWPDVTVIVHPECRYEVAQKADLTGSTESIIHAIENAAAGSRWAVGTEIHLVHRLAQQAAKRNVTVRMLSDCQCLCTTMYRIDMPHLLWAMDNLVGGTVVNQIQVPTQTAHWARVAWTGCLRSRAKRANPLRTSIGPANFAVIRSRYHSYNAPKRCDTNYFFIFYSPLYNTTPSIMWYRDAQGVVIQFLKTRRQEEVEGEEL